MTGGSGYPAMRQIPAAEIPARVRPPVFGCRGKRHIIATHNRPVTRHRKVPLVAKHRQRRKRHVVIHREQCIRPVLRRPVEQGPRRLCRTGRVEMAQTPGEYRLPARRQFGGASPRDGSYQRPFELTVWPAVPDEA